MDLQCNAVGKMPVLFLDVYMGRSCVKLWEITFFTSQYSWHIIFSSSFHKSVYKIQIMAEEIYKDWKKIFDNEVFIVWKTEDKGT